MSLSQLNPYLKHALELGRLARDVAERIARHPAEEQKRALARQRQNGTALTMEDLDELFPNDVSDWITVGEAARLAGISKSGISERCRPGGPLRYVGKGRTRRINPRDVDRLIMDRKAGKKWSPPRDPEDGYTVLEAAQKAGVSKSMINHAIRRAILEAAGFRYQRRITHESLDRYIRRRQRRNQGSAPEIVAADAPSSPALPAASDDLTDARRAELAESAAIMARKHGR